MVPPRSFSSSLLLTSLIVVALAVMGCDNNKAPTPRADPAAEAKATTTTTAAPPDTSASAVAATTTASAAPATSVEPTAVAADTSPDTSPDKAAVTPKPGPDNAAPSATASAVASAVVAPPDEPAGKTFGEKKVESMYAAWLQSGGRYTVGKPATVQAVVVAKGEYKTNQQYPFKFKVTSTPAGVAINAPVVRGAKKTKSRAVVSIPITPTSAGPKTIRGTYYFSVCNASTCKIGKAPMSVTIQVNEK